LVELIVFCRSSKDGNTRKAAAEPVSVDSNTVYLEDLDDPNFTSPSKQPAQIPKESPSSAQKKKNKWHDYDPYRLPEVDDSVLTKPTSSTAPDPRLATEEELRQFIETMKPSDFDVNSPEFRALPTEVQYEIIGDMRLKSRQTSYRRLQSMMQNSKSAMDFSMAQIKGLKQRNNLTQQLLTTTDTIGKAHIEIPIRIASERNREYVLVQNDGPEGGWVLGIRDTGTAANPIKVDADPPPIENVAYDSDDDIEVSVDHLPL
jgi:DNA excision repair protein ERCC-5